ncbi:MAG: RluA family pseudouridine synthase [Clostridia bacterium]|nr:RluA family pseudouridine synthase [Clostridia bacterium]
MQSCVVLPEEEGRRIREIIRGRMRVSYSAMKRAKWNGAILLNGERTTVDVRVRAGDRLELRLPEQKPVYAPEPYALALRIPYEDAALMVVDKPAPLASQSSRRHPHDSLENAVFHTLGCPPDFIYRPVNRLDKGTSGLMVIAKDPHTQDLLQKALHSDQFIREYVALTEGVPSPAEGVIALPIGKAEGATIRREVRPDGQMAVTRYRVLGEREGRGLVRLRLETGRTHQIRVHLAAIGCPVCGDFLYGREWPERFPGRFALHSTYLKLMHPLTGEWVEHSSQAPWEEAGFFRS